MNSPRSDYPATVIDGREIMKSELDEAFDMVRNPEHWKLPIKTTIEWPGTSTLKVILEAVEYFTATEAKAFPEVFTLGAQEYVTITADGYYAGPAA